MIAPDGSVARTLQTPPSGLEDGGAPVDDASLELPLDEILARVDGDRELLVTLAELQQAESPRALEEIRTLLDRGEAPGLEHAAHRLVGSLLVFGAADAADAARSVELLGRESRLAEARGQFATLEFEVQRVIAALDRLIHKSRS